MSISIDLEVDIRQAMVDFGMLEHEADRAASIAINRVADATKGEAAKIIAGRASLKLGKVRKRIRVERASRNRLLAIVTGKPYSPNMGNYSPAQGAFGTQALVPPGRIASVRHAFILKRRGSPVMVRARSGSGRVGRTPLESVRVEVLQKTWVSSTVDAALRRNIAVRWPPEFQRAIAFVMQKFNR